MNIETAVVVILGLTLTIGPIVVGSILLARGGRVRREAQMGYLSWLAAGGADWQEQPATVAPGQPGSAAAAGQPGTDVPYYQATSGPVLHQPVGPPPPIPPQVQAVGRGLRIWGWVLIVFGVLVLLTRLAGGAAGM